MKLTMTSSLATEKPAFTFEFADDFTYLHRDTTVGRISALDQVPVRVCVANPDVSGSDYEATCTTATCAVGGGTTSPCSRISSMCI